MNKITHFQGKFLYPSTMKDGGGGQAPVNRPRFLRWQGLSSRRLFKEYVVIFLYLRSSIKLIIVLSEFPTVGGPAPNGRSGECREKQCSRNYTAMCYV
jgi:hypothetical protein